MPETFDGRSVEAQRVLRVKIAPGNTNWVFEHPEGAMGLTWWQLLFVARRAWAGDFVHHVDKALPERTIEIAQLSETERPVLLVSEDVNQYSLDLTMLFLLTLAEHQCLVNIMETQMKRRAAAAGQLGQAEDRRIIVPKMVPPRVLAD